MNATKVANRIKSIGDPQMRPRARGHQHNAEDDFVPPPRQRNSGYRDANGRDMSEMGLTGELLEKHKDAINRGEVPQELRDLGIAEIKIVNGFDRMKERMQNIRDRFSRNDNVQSVSNSEYDMNDDVGMGDSEDMTYDDLEMGQASHDPGDEFDSMTDERKEELGYHPRAEYRTMAPHIREEWDARFNSEPAGISETDMSADDLSTEQSSYGLGTEFDSMTDDAIAALSDEDKATMMGEREAQNNRGIGNRMGNESILDRAGYVDVDMGDGTMAQARYSPEDTEIIKNKIRESMHLSDSDINDLGSLSDSQSMAANAGNMNDTESMYNGSIHLSASDIDDLSTSQPSHQL